MRPKIALLIACVLGLLSPLVVGPRAIATTSDDDIDIGAGPVTPYGCTAGQGDCIPTPMECATGSYNGHYPQDPTYAVTELAGATLPHRTADCLGGNGHITHYIGGDLNVPCGTIIDNDVPTDGGWFDDPNVCQTEAEHHIDRNNHVGHGRRFEPAVTGSGVVVSVSQVASKAGARVLADGGNAVDAAVAAVFTAGFARPGMGGMGGNGHLIYRSASGHVAALDFESVFPKAARPEDFAPEAMGPLSGPGQMPGYTGHRVVGVPGVVAGMYDVEEAFGGMGWEKVLQYPIDLLDRGGATVTPGAANDYGNVPMVHQAVPGQPGTYVGEDAAPPSSWRENQIRLSMFPHSAEVYLTNNRPYMPGEKLDPKDMEADLKALQHCGKDIFYDVDDTCGDHNIAKLIADDMDHSRTNPVAPGDEGLLTAQDLKDYDAIWRPVPASTTYHHAQIFGPPAPDYGVTQVLESLNILEPYNLGSIAFDSAEHRHLLAETQKLARADVMRWVNDPAYVAVPQRTLLSKDYAAKRRALIKEDAAQSFEAGDAGNVDGAHGPKSTVPPAVHNTNNVSVIDRWGNAIAINFSINETFGSAVVPPGTGFLLNSNTDPAPVDSPQAIIGGHRGLSPISPMIVVKNGRNLLAIGGVGGDLIPQNVLEVITNVLDYGQDIATAVDAARSHEPVCCNLVYEDWRAPDGVTDTLNSKDSYNPPHVVQSQGEYMWTGSVEAAMSPSPGVATAAGDRRAELHAAAAAS